MTLSNTSFSNISLSETNNEIELEAKGNYCLAVITSINVIVSIICLLYITLKLLLNKFIKTILCIMAIQNILSSTILTIANTFMIVFNDQSYITCQSIYSSLFVQFRSISTMTALISIIRYVMVSKASNARVIQKNHITFSIFFCALFPYLNGCIKLMIGGKLVHLCMDLPFDDIEELTLLDRFNGSLFFLSLGSGIFFDHKMMVFVKNRNRIEPIQLIPWKLVDSSEKETDMVVPIRATIISTIFMISFCILIPIFRVLDNFWYITICIALCSITPLPLTVIFSIKKTNAEKKVVQPPQGLQFHNENFEKGISFPLQFHGDFEMVEENVDTERLNELSAIVHVQNNPETPSQDEHDEEAKEIMSKAAKVSSMSNCQNSMKLNVQSLTEINC